MTKSLTLTLYIKELIYDLESKTSLTADSKQGNTDPAVISSIKGGDAMSNDQLLRSLGAAFAQLKSQLSEYISIEQKSADNRLISDETNLTLTLNRLPSNFNEATADAIANSAHNFVVNTTLVDWFLSTSQQDAKEYSVLASANMLELRTAINKRTRPIRVEPKP